MNLDPTAFRYADSRRWYKGNTHIHSVASDGGLDFAALAAAYAGAGYDFLFRTDHWVASSCGSDTAEYPLLWIDGIELDGHDEAGSYYHIVALGTFGDIRREMGLAAALAAVKAQDGFTVLAHPCWTGNTFEEALRWDFDAVERYNNVCQYLNGKGDATAHWQAMLSNGGDTLSLAVDDAHTKPNSPVWNGGWVMVQAGGLRAGAIMAALGSGRYYSTTGPQFHSIMLQGTQVVAETSPVRFARLVGPASRGARTGSPGAPLLTEVAFEIPVDWAYAYLEIEDDKGRRAWTNTLFATGDGPGK